MCSGVPQMELLIEAKQHGTVGDFALRRIRWSGAEFRGVFKIAVIGDL